MQYTWYSCTWYSEMRIVNNSEILLIIKIQSYFLTGKPSLRLPQNCSFTPVNCAFWGFASLITGHSDPNTRLMDGLYLNCKK